MVAQSLKHLPTMGDTLVGSLDWGDPLEKQVATLQYSCLENPMNGEAW